MTPQAFTDAISASFKQLFEHLEHLERRLHSDDRAAAHQGGPGHLATGSGARVSLQGAIRRMVLHGRRSLRSRNAARQRPLPGLRRGGRSRQRGELLLQAVALRKAAARAVRTRPRLRHARHPPQRSALVRESRPEGSERQPHVVQVGRARARRSQARDVRLVRRAHELHHRGGISGRHGNVRQVLACRRAPDGEGDRPFPRRVLARVPDGRGSAASEAHRRPRLVADERRQDVEVAWQCRAAAVVHEGVRRRRLPIFLPARDDARPRRQLQRRGVSDALQRRSRQRPRQSGEPRDDHGASVLRRGRARGEHGRRGSGAYAAASRVDSTRCSRAWASRSSFRWRCATSGM